MLGTNAVLWMEESYGVVVILVKASTAVMLFNAIRPRIRWSIINIIVSGPDDGCDVGCGAGAHGRDYRIRLPVVRSMDRMGMAIRLYRRPWPQLTQS